MSSGIRQAVGQWRVQPPAPSTASAKARAVASIACKPASSGFSIFTITQLSFRQLRCASKV
jgi:hypothetical protein